MSARIVPCSASVLPNATRLLTRAHIASSARSAAPIEPHAVMDASGAEPALRDLESAAFAEQHVSGRHANVLEQDLRVPVRRVVEAEHRQHALDAHAGRVHRHEDHRLLLMLRRVGVAATHEDRDAAARVAGAGDPPLAAVDDVLVAVARDAGADVGGIRRGDVGLGHREAGANLAGEQRLEPLPLLLGRAVADQHFHVAGVGRGAVEHLRARSPASAP